MQDLRVITYAVFTRPEDLAHFFRLGLSPMTRSRNSAALSISVNGLSQQI
ncbi:MAG: hypothetical protein RLZZ596_2561 [Pseudomonadota bacterium]|jgi:hypothetical protein